MYSKHSHPTRYRSRPTSDRRLHLETLEHRRLLAVFPRSTISTTRARAVLRDAIGLANADSVADEITFSVTGTINLASQLPTITQPLTITGPGADLLTLDAGDGADNTFGTGDGYRIFRITGAETLDVEISGLTLTGGDTPDAELGGGNPKLEKPDGYLLHHRSK